VQPESVPFFSNVGETCFKGGSSQAWKGEKGAPSWKGGEAQAGKGLGSTGDASTGKGKGSFFSMAKVLQGFADAKCLPGQNMTNDDNALYVSGLPKDCDDLHLYRLMAPFGAIPASGVKAMKYPDGNCKGFGFVNYIEPTAMEAAMQMLHGTLLPDGTVMNVTPKQNKNEAKGTRKSFPLSLAAFENGEAETS